MALTICAPLDVAIMKGEAVTFNWLHQTSATDTTPINITGWAITVLIRAQYSSAALLTKTASITSGAAGTYSWSLTHTETDALPCTVYVISVWRTDALSERPMASGTFTVQSSAQYGI